MPKKDLNPADVPHLNTILEGLIKRRLSTSAEERRNIGIQIAEAGKHLSASNRNGR